MGQIRNYPPVKYFAAITFTKEELLEEIRLSLQKLFSIVDNQSNVFSFSKFTSYYEPEMGEDLKKIIISFQQLNPAEMLPDLKIATNQIESDYLENNKRQINIDPGYVCAAKMILATSKDYDHRIYLNRGIFGDIHYRFRQGKFQINDWTYPDYQQSFIIEFFELMREKYLNQLKDWNDLK
jgi:hypothetical protein